MGGGDSQIKCELALLKAAIKGEYEYYHLLSGQDLPIKSQEEILAFFDENFGNNYIKVDWKAMDDGYHIDRVQKYYFFQNMISRREGHWIGLLRRINRFSVFLQEYFNIDRLQNCSKKIYKGTNWFSITHEMALLVLSEERFIRKHCYRAFCADEIFLQTVAMNSHLLNTIIDEDLRCIDWTRGNPYTYREDDYVFLMNSKCLFARKFSDNIDPKIVQKIANNLL